MICKACHFVHSPLENCGVARRKREAVSNVAVSNNPVSNNLSPDVAINKRGTLPRVQKWRNENREKYNAKMREWMRANRPKKNKEASFTLPVK